MLVDSDRILIIMLAVKQATAHNKMPLIATMRPASSFMMPAWSTA